MKKLLLAILAVAIIAVAYWLVSPLFIERRVSEKIEDIMPPGTTSATMLPVAQGTFVGLEGHTAQGTAKLIKSGDASYVRFEDDFRVTNGPDLYVYLGRDGKYVPATRLGALKGNVGGQNYSIPADVNPKDYNEVWVWCRAFSVAFGKAELK